MDGGATRGRAADTAPVDEEAERAVLAACLLDEGREAVVARVRALLRPEDFACAVRATVFEALLRVADAGTPLDVVSLAAELRRAGRLHAVGGPQALGELTDTIPTLAHVETHARIVAELARARAVHREARTLAARIAAGDTAPGEVMAGARRVLEAAADDASAELEEIGVGADAEARRMLEDGAPADVVPSGIAPLDAVLAGGGWPGQTIVVGARPSVGKSALALLWAVTAAEWCARRGEGVVVFVSLEMPHRDLASRAACLLASLAGESVDLKRARAKTLTGPESNAYDRALDRLRQLPLLVCDKRTTRPSQVRALALRAKARHGRVALLVVDYLQKMEPEQGRDSREREVAETSRILSALAAEVGAPLIALSQLNRKADDRRPTLADLRESGAIEQDADVVLLLHREERDRARPEVEVAKQRNGPAPETVALGWIAGSARFTAREGAHHGHGED